MRKEMFDYFCDLKLTETEGEEHVYTSKIPKNQIKKQKC